MVVPTPTACPCTAATIGFSALITTSRKRPTCRGPSKAPADWAAKSLMSLPAEKKSPVDVNSTTRMSSFVCASVTASAIAPYMALVMAFFFSGRLNRISRTAPSRRTMMCSSLMGGFRWRSVLEPIAGLENPPHCRKANREEYRDRGQADADVHVGRLLAEEGPTETADQINDGVEQRDLIPRFRQHLDRIEGAAKECERRQDQHRHDLQLF